MKTSKFVNRVCHRCDSVILFVFVEVAKGMSRYQGVLLKIYVTKATSATLEHKIIDL